jgi:DNA replication licensing factor MCM2
MIRMAEASARMCLRNEVFPQDFELSAKVFLESFVQAQKISVRKALYRSFNKYIINGEDKFALLMHHLQGLLLDVEKYKYVSFVRKTVYY